jgi:hypothetical protein
MNKNHIEIPYAIKAYTYHGKVYNVKVSKKVSTA